MKTFRKSEQNFRTIFEYAPIGIDIVNAEGRPLHVNREFQKMLGYTEEEFRQMLFTEYTHPDDVEKSLQLTRKLLEGHRQHAEIEKRYYRKDGVLVWGYVKVSAVRDSQERFQYFIAMIEDITERKQAEKALRREKDFSDSLIQNSVDGIIAFDPLCRYTAWNPGMERITGLQRKEVLGKYAFDVFPFLQETGEEHCFYEALAGNTVFTRDRPFTIPQTDREGYYEG